MEICQHITQDVLEGARKLKILEDKDNNKCKTCQNNSNVYMCLDCNDLSCYNNLHFKEHLTESQHKLSLNFIKRVIYCSICDKYNFVPNLDIEFERHYKVLPPKKYKGFANLGNTCYLNSILQIFFNSEIIQSQFFSSKHELVICKIKNCFFCSLKSILIEMFSEKSVLVVPKTFLMTHISKYFDIKSQQDAHEFFLQLSQWIHDSHTSMSFNNIECTCIIHNSFFGILKNILICSDCNTKSIIDEGYVCISLHIDDSTESISDSLAKFMMEEVLIEELNCNTCSKKTKFTRKIVFSSYPSLLCFHLKRFELKNKRIKKIDKFIKYPTTLKIENISYELTGVLCHKGNMSSGHYFTYIGQGQKWIKCDDDIIKTVSLDNVLNSEAFMLLYNKINNN
ncbi:putative ubiquitin carboxyl-terminal hydrolase 8 [Astathelohania contejeani]|uniref:Ubiquitin carboxyl-terminal hydrolase n=1 Tax=Astathelohania contejeani TaxID=164912 RepID=A0ABQ7HYV9_9MICR|nr:putative ubiquitin carboxyl-terminal hydrolase 8 [Thelohania contejeani]